MTDAQDLPFPIFWALTKDEAKVPASIHNISGASIKRRSVPQKSSGQILGMHVTFHRLSKLENLFLARQWTSQ
jgi:hypothetical protein